MVRFPYFLSFLIFFFAFISASQAVQPETVRVSIDSNGNESNSDNSFASISGNGRYIAFTSYASNLVSEDTNGSSDIFVHDRQTGETTRVSVDSSGNQANWDSYRPAISDNGRYVAFESYATNLVSGDTTSGLTDVFVHDRQTGETTRVSVDSSGNEANNFSQNASISSDGKYVAFRSSASNLVDGDTNGTVDVFVHDMITGETTLVSVDSSGNQTNEGIFTCIISNDGRYVTFDTYADNLVNGDTNGMQDIFVHDRQTGETTRVSVDSSGNQSNGNSEFPDISTNGRYVAFQSFANNLVNGDTNGIWDIFIHDRQTGQTTRVSVDSLGNESNSDSSFASISSDGNYVAFQAMADNLVSGDTNGWDDIFVHDRQTGKTTRVSVDSLGNESNYACYMPSISSDGIYVSFESWANNLVIDDTNGNIDVFVRGPLFDRGTFLPFLMLLLD